MRAGRLVALALLTWLWGSGQERAGLFRQADRDRAIRRGIAFIAPIASNPEYSTEYSTDLLWCLYSFSATSADPEIREITERLARDAAARWLKLHPNIPSNADPDDLVDFGTGVYAAKHLGLETGGLIAEMRKQAPTIPVQDYFGFDPRREPPPAGPRRYDIWCDALITAQAGEINGVQLGASFAEVIQWLPAMRPYPPRTTDPHFYSTLYSITHAIYTINSYSVYAVDRECLRPEFEYLRANWQEAIALNDPETMGEFLDTLRAFGMTTQDQEIQRGMEFLLSTQNADGSWGNPHDPSIYNRYHSTWAAIDGLRDYRFQPARACPEFR
jgi:hypothetical protein